MVIFKVFNLFIQQSQNTCCKIVHKKIRDKITTWLQSRLTPELLNKDLMEDANKLLRQAIKQENQDNV